jgi:hypothetical protein
MATALDTLRSGGMINIPLDLYSASTSGADIVEITGYSAATSTSIEDISVRGADNDYLTATTGVQLGIKSGDDVDSGTGVGGQVVRLSYLDEDWTEQTEDVTLTGQTAANTTATDILRVNSARVIQVGTSAQNSGAITIHEYAASASTYLTIGATANTSQCGFYYVPANKVLLITDIVISAYRNANDLASVYIYRQKLFGTAEYMEEVSQLFSAPTGAPYGTHISLRTGLVVDEKCRVRFRADTAAAGTVELLATGILLSTT